MFVHSSAGGVRPSSLTLGDLLSSPVGATPVNVPPMPWTCVANRRRWGIPQFAMPFVVGHADVCDA